MGAFHPGFRAAAAVVAGSRGTVARCAVDHPVRCRARHPARLAAKAVALVAGDVGLGVCRLRRLLAVVDAVALRRVERFVAVSAVGHRLPAWRLAAQCSAGAGRLRAGDLGQRGDRRGADDRSRAGLDHPGGAAGGPVRQSRLPGGSGVAGAGRRAGLGLRRHAPAARRAGAAVPGAGRRAGAGLCPVGGPRRLCSVDAGRLIRAVALVAGGSTRRRNCPDRGGLAQFRHGRSFVDLASDHVASRRGESDARRAWHRLIRGLVERLVPGLGAATQHVQHDDRFAAQRRPAVRVGVRFRRGAAGRVCRRVSTEAVA